MVESIYVDHWQAVYMLRAALPEVEEEPLIFAAMALIDRKVRSANCKVWGRRHHDYSDYSEITPLEWVGLAIDGVGKEGDAIARPIPETWGPGCEARTFYQLRYLRSEIEALKPAFVKLFRPEGEQVPTSEANKTGLAGRPTAWDKIKAECERRSADGEKHPTTTEWARVLLEWHRKTNPSDPQPKEKTLTNKLAGLLREILAAASNSKKR